MSLPKRGDVVLVLFPNSDLVTIKARPALVVQSDRATTDLPQILVVAITSQMFRAGYPSRMVVLAESSIGRVAGLLTDSVIIADNIVTVETSDIARIIGTLPMNLIDPVNLIDPALRYVLELP